MLANLFPGTTSIIIPCWNQLEFTRQCIASVLRHTRGMWELIIIDNGSTDATAGYLANLRDAAPLPVTLISNSKNLGFPAAINQGLGCARGEYLVLLNNDVVVTEGWLEQLIALVSIAPPVRGGKSESKASETDSTRKAQGTPTKRVGFSEVRNAYPGRNITVIDLAYGNDGTPVQPVQPHPTSPASAPTNAPIPESRIALVGPMSNYAPPPQLVENVPYRDLSELHLFARAWRDRNRGKWMRVPKLSGFCILMKRAVYQAIGGLDEQFGLGFFDDDDLAQRARRAGFELAVAGDLFVHHFGSRTFAGNGINAEKVLEENAAKFAAKWGSAVPQGRRVTLRPLTSEPVVRQETAIDSLTPQREAKAQDRNETAKVGIDAQTRFHVKTDIPITSPAATGDSPHRSVATARISLTMIVKNEEANLPHALRSANGLFDEIVVVDTGSQDATIRIAQQFGARVVYFPWIDDFAAARNAALAHATGNYAFWLDADDVIEPSETQKLHALLGRIRRGEPLLDQSTPPAVHAAPPQTAYVLRCACDPAPDGTGGDTVVDHIRLFPLLEGVRWTYKVHEQILPALRRLGVPVQWTDITIRHTGYTDQVLRARKLDRDSRILLGELGERPNDPFINFNLGMIAVERKQWQNALGYLRRSLAGSAPSDSITRKLFALIARVQETLGDTEAALRTCAEGLSLEPDDAELWFRKAVAHRLRGEPALAERAWRRILSLRRPEKFASVDQGIYGHVTRRNLAELARARGDHEEAQRLWRAVLVECPADRDALRNLKLGGV
jgi:glycosyltransferase involved in cell wall biosynthesis